MKYIAQTNGSYAAVDEASELYALLKQLPKERRPKFLAATSAEVVAYLTKKKEPAKK